LISLQVHTDLRDKLAIVKNLQMIQDIVTEMKTRLINEFGDVEVYDGPFEKKNDIYELPIWVAQPYIRPPLPLSESQPEKRKAETKQKPKKQPKLLCIKCPNVRPLKTDLCKACLRKEATQEIPVLEA
jgi:hypothetical protein